MRLQAGFFGEVFAVFDAALGHYGVDAFDVYHEYKLPRYVN
tara:strand:- start:124 stop:246 length:123 start_codon:yes stop_codon:yes gene_type:complete